MDNLSSTGRDSGEDSFDLSGNNVGGIGIVTGQCVGVGEGHR